MNEILTILILIISILAIYTLYKLLNKDGLYMWATIAIILSFLFSYRIGNVLNFEAFITLPLYMSLFFVYYLCMEKYGKRETKKLAFYSAVVCVLAAIFLILMTFFLPSISDNISGNLNIVFFNNYLVFISIQLCLIFSSNLTIYLYDILKRQYNNIFISTTLSCILVQLLDCVLFLSIIFLGESFDKTTDLILSNYIYRLITVLIFIPVLYNLTKKKKVKK